MTVRTRLAPLADRAAGLVGPRVPATSPVGRRLRTLHRRLVPVPERPIARVIAEYARAHPTATFVQIGAHDGTQLDPLQDAIRTSGWTGVMVEPVPYVFDRLRANNVGNDRVSLANVAIADEDGTRDFHHLAQAEDGAVWKWYDALGSFRRDVVLSHRHLIPDIEDRLVTVPVPCRTFESLCREHGLEHVDVVQIDTEGYDREVLELIDLDRFGVGLVMFENLHLAADDHDACRRRLHDHGFETIADGMDTLALRRDAATQPRLARAWRAARKQPDPADRPAPVSVKRRARTVLERVIRPFGYELQPVGAAAPAADDGFTAALVDQRTPLPPGAEADLRSDHPRLAELRAAYDALDWPVVVHSRWQPEHFEHWLDLRFFRGDNFYVWHYRESRRISELKFFVFLQYVAARDEAGLLDRLTEDGAFGCWTYEFPGHPRCSRDLLDAVNELSFLDRQLGLLGQEQLRVLDIGAGYGRLAHRTAGAVAGLADYCCVDAVAPSTFLCEYYTRQRGVAPPVRVVPLPDVPQTEGPFDIAFNVHSFSECTYDAIAWWVATLERLAVPRLFLVPNEPSGFLSLERDGSRRDYLPLLEAAGYRLTVDEHVFDDEAVRLLLDVHDRHCLFERAG